MKTLYKILRIIFSLLVVTIILCGAYLYYEKNIKNKNIDNNTSNIDNNTSITYGSIIQDEIEDIEEEFLHLFWDINNLSEITNQDKLDIGLIKYKELNNYDNISDITTITKSSLEDAINKSILSDTSITHENIKNFVINSRCGHDLFTYKDDNYTQVVDAHGACVVDAKKVYSNLETLSDNEYKYIAKYVFVYGCEGDDLSNIYGKYNDAINKQNSITSVEGDLSTYAKSNYEDIKDKLATYNYIFKKENDIIKLISMNVE